MEISKLIKERRKYLGLTMKQLGQKAGTSESAVSRWEAGQIENMKRDTILKVADALHLSPLVFLGQDLSEAENVKIPILKKITTEMPIFAQENIEGMVEIGKELDHGTMFALRVIGKSMEPQILENDLLIIRQQEDVDSGDIAIIIINGNETTIKQVQKTKDGITLVGFNISLYLPHFYSNQEVNDLKIQIIGKVIESRHMW